VENASMTPDAVRREFDDLLQATDGFVELRFHRKTVRSTLVENGRVEASSLRRRLGVGVRVVVDGAFGFASTGTCDKAAVRRAIDKARDAARRVAPKRRDRLPTFPKDGLVRGNFELPGVAEIESRPFEEKVDLARATEAAARRDAASVQAAACSYSEIVEEKAIVTSDGASASYRLARPEFRVNAVAVGKGERQTAARTVGVTGGWDCLFKVDAAERLAKLSAETATNLLAAKRPKGGRATTILAPSIVGLLVHEAIGHTVEADFVAAGSVAAGKIGTRVASELVTLCDSGAAEFSPGAGGTLPFDDEGVLAGRTVVIERGVLKSYLHDRESAARAGVPPTGNARAWEYSDAPLIRMRNTYLEPGTSTLEEMIAGVEDGYLLDGPRNGQADATGEFMFGVERAYRIRDGRLCELVRGVTLSGTAFDVLSTIDAVGRDFRWDLGAGYCGKGQPAKVDAGGPFVRCRALLGGEQ
jgi:TldD protein